MVPGTDPATRRQSTANSNQTVAQGKQNELETIECAI